jgi:hypothetical protein
MGIRNFILQRVKFERGENWAHKTQVFRFFCLFYLPLFNSVTQKIQGWKNIGGGDLPPDATPPQVTHMVPYFVCVSSFISKNKSCKRYGNHDVWLHIYVTHIPNPWAWRETDNSRNNRRMVALQICFKHLRNLRLTHYILGQFKLVGDWRHCRSAVHRS